MELAINRYNIIKYINIYYYYNRGIPIMPLEYLISVPPALLLYKE